MTLGMEIHKINVDKITADMCTTGKLRPTQLKIELNNAFRFGLPVINKILAAHPIKIPTHVGKYFELSDLTVGYEDDYLALGLTPTFIKPAQAQLERVQKHSLELL